MTVARRSGWLIISVLSLMLVIGCGSDTDSGSAADKKVTEKTATDARYQFEEPRADEKAQMQADVDEAIERLKYADKGKLWEMEFEYLRDRSTFDDYLEFAHIKRFNADSVHRIDLKEFDFYGDTCAIEVDIVFIGPTGDTSVQRTTHHMFYNGDRWIRPTFTATPAALELQQEYEAIIRAADSAAKAEAAEGL